MPILLTVFGVETEGLDPTLCYTLLRAVRGPGMYPDPTLPKGTKTDGISRSPIPDTPLGMITWDKIIPSGEEEELHTALDKGSLTIPSDCPIAGGQTIAGLPFGPLIVEEEFQRARITGIGLLFRKGIATEEPFKALKTTLIEKLKPGTAPKAIRSLITEIAVTSGIDEIFRKHRPMGGVELFYRAPAVAYRDGALFDLVPDKPNFRTKNPMLRVFVRRYAARLDQKFALQITLGNFDEILCSMVLDIDAGVPEIIVSAPAHITDVSLAVFDDAGNLVDRLNGRFLQSFNFGLMALGAIDALPPPFSGAPKSPDLQERPRLHTTAFTGPAMASRSGGLDILRKRDDDVSALLGPLSPEPENVWFERGPEGQVEVIRWIKKKIEQPSLSRAYLVDPYLGSEALQRVVARQGNETAELFIVLSPGDVDPDADVTATAAGSDYLNKLHKTASDWADKLAGRVSIVHVKRGDGSRQAFHDRYLCTVDRKGVPTTYLLSNSLSKAAGDWPFAISELNRVTSWRVYAYILEMIGGHAPGLEPEVIWQRSDASIASQWSAVPASAPSGSIPEWVVSVNALLMDIWNTIIRNSEFKSQVSGRIDAFLRVWPQNIDMEKFADALFKVASHRDAIVVFVSDHLRNAGRAELANMLDERLLNRFLELLPERGKKSDAFIPFEARRGVLTHLAKTIARKSNATNFIRARFNAKVHVLVSVIETQRVEQTLSWSAHESALFLSIIALEVAASVDAPLSHRTGLATDYIHWLGRLMRSDVADQSYVAPDSAPVELLDDLIFAAQAVAKARHALGEALDGPIGRVKDDPWVAPIFQDKLALLT